MFIRIMEVQCRMSKKHNFLPEFSITTLGIIIRGRERERGIDGYLKGKGDNWGLEREGKRETEWSKTKSPRRAGPPAPTARLAVNP